MVLIPLLFMHSGQCLTEEYYVVNKLIKGFIGSNNIDTNSRLCMSSAVVAYKMSLGEDSVPVSYDDIELADMYFCCRCQSCLVPSYFMEKGGSRERKKSGY